MMKGKRKIARGLLCLAAFIRVSAACGQIAYASDISLTLEGSSGSGKPMDMLDIMFLFLFLAVVPSLLIMMTSFTRIIIVLSFLRNALGTQQSPPNQVMIGLALFLTLFIMNPVFAKVNTQAYEPYKAGEITREEAFTRAQEPMKEFMLKQTEKKSLDLFLSISKSEVPDVSGGPEAYMKLGLTVLVPSFILSELNKAFTMGFLIYIPFLIIDLVVSSTLMSMGMVMLPPTMIALPFKIMTADQVMEVMKEAMMVAFEIAGPLLIVSIVVGLIVAIFQAATQIHEQTLTFVPKLLVIALVLLALGSWMFKVMDEFVVELFAIMASL